MAKQNAYTLHKPRKLRFPRRKTYSKGIADLYHIDLVDLASLCPFNYGMIYLLTCIDVFTKRAWAVSVRTKSGRYVAEAFETIITEQKCKMVQRNKGMEFLNSTFQSMLKCTQCDVLHQRKRRSECRCCGTVQQNAQVGNVSLFHSSEYETVSGRDAGSLAFVQSQCRTAVRTLL